MNPYINQAGVYLIQAIFGIYILAVLLRLLFQLTRADFYNQIAQFVVVFTNPPLLFLRRFIPGWLGIDMAAVVLLLALKALEIYLLAWIQDMPMKPAGVIVLAAAKLLELTIYVFIVAVLIRVVLSWVNPYGGSRHPAADLLYSLTEPLLRPARRLIPPFSGLDLSPIAVFLLLELTLILIIQPLKDFGALLLIR